MKRFFFCTGILVLLLGMSHTHASDVSFSQLNSSGTIKTTIGVSTTATVANISVDIQNNPQIAITGTLTAYRTVSSTGVCSDSILTGPVSVADGQSTYHHTFKMENLEANHQYCFKYSDDNGVTFAPKVFKTESGILTIPYNWPLISSNATGQKVLVSGKINTATYTGSVGSLAIDLQISANPFPINQSPDIVGDQTHNYARVNVDTSSPEGVASDGSYYFPITGLAPSTKYYCRQVISFKNTTTILDVKGENCVLDSDQGIVPQGSKLEQSLEEQKSYHLLAPWPGLSELMDPDLCLQKQKEGTLSPNAVCDINGFLDFAFKTLIGITAVMLVLRLMYEGYQYIVTDVPFLKASAKSGFFTALLGLLLALSAYLILNTINPKLVSNSFSINSINTGVEEFTISGALSSSFSATPVKIKFSTEAYPAAKAASEKTGVNISFILAEFQQETGNGANVGKCHWTDPGVMKEADKVPFQTITSELGRNPNITVVSCAAGGGSGGAIGLMQFRPATWLENRMEAKNYLGHMPDPWNVNDALMVAAVYLKKLGGISDMRNAACKYYSGSLCKTGRQPPNEFYGNEVMQKKAGFDVEIQKKKAKGEIQ